MLERPTAGRGLAAVGSSRSSARRSSPRSPTSTRATSPRTSRPAPIRLPAALGDRPGQPHGDVRAEPVGQARAGHRACPCRSTAGSSYPRPVVLGLWGQAELVADGDRPGRDHRRRDRANLLFGLDLLIGGLITGGWAFLLLAVQAPGGRRYIHAWTAYFGLIAVAFLLLVLRRRHRRVKRGRRTGAPLRRRGQPLLAAGILGATVMPHAIYLHSALVTETTEPSRSRRSGRSCGRSGSMSPRR